MKPKQEVDIKKIVESITINPKLTGQSAGQPYIQKKVDRANEILKKHGIPKELMR